MKYRKISYKYILEQDYSIVIPWLLLPFKSSTTFINPVFNNALRHMNIKIDMGYAWDGCSGPTIDTEGTMEASLVHDALYQLIRLGNIPLRKRKFADKLFLDLLEENKVNLIRRWYFYLAVRWFGEKAAQP